MTNMKSEFIKKSILAELTLYKTEDRGRQSPFYEGYRPHLRVNGEGEYLGVRVINQKSWVYPGESTVCEFALMYFPDVNYFELLPGVEFTIVEGTETVGTGKVVRGINDLSPY